MSERSSSTCGLDRGRLQPTACDLADARVEIICRGPGPSSGRERTRRVHASHQQVPLYPGLVNAQFPKVQGDQPRAAPSNGPVVTCLACRYPPSVFLLHGHRKAKQVRAPHQRKGAKSAHDVGSHPASEAEALASSDCPQNRCVAAPRGADTKADGQIVDVDFEPIGIRIERIREPTYQPCRRWFHYSNQTEATKWLLRDEDRATVASSKPKRSTGAIECGGGR